MFPTSSVCYSDELHVFMVVSGEQRTPHSRCDVTHIPLLATNDMLQPGCVLTGIHASYNSVFVLYTKVKLRCVSVAEQRTSLFMWWTNTAAVT